MLLKQALSPQTILLDIEQTRKDDAIRRITHFLCATFQIDDSEEIARKILVREKEMSTGIGFGIAIPHARISGLENLSLVAARTRHPLEYQAIDDEPVRLIFMMLSPRGAAQQHTEILSKLSQILALENNRKALLEVESAEEFYAIICSAEESFAA